jgi:hypothetical protein
MAFRPIGLRPIPPHIVTVLRDDIRPDHRPRQPRHARRHRPIAFDNRQIRRRAVPGDGAGRRKYWSDAGACKTPEKYNRMRDDFSLQFPCD